MRDASQGGEPGRRDRGTGLRAEIGLGLFGSLAAVAVPLALLAAPRSDVLAVVGGSGESIADLARIVAQADGAILGPGGPDNVILARSDRAGFAARLYAAGARLVLDAGLARSCGRSSARLTPPFTPTGTPIR